MIKQIKIILKPYPKGFHLITHDIVEKLPELPECGLLNLFIQHTSAALTINENADPDVRIDLRNIYEHIIKEGESYYLHTAEGIDDMPAHASSTLTGVSINIPISGHRLALGTWQGIFLCEFRKNGGSRRIIATILS